MVSGIIYPELSYTVQGAIYAVYNDLRYFGLSEKGWENALMIALAERNVPAERQVEYELRYQGYRIGRFFVDIVVDDRLLLELKTEDALLPIDQGQVLNYLKVSNLKLGILVNLGDQLQIQRIPNYLGDRAAVRPQTRDSRNSEQWLYPELTRELRGLLYDIHSELGPGYMHMHYRRATRIELRRHGIPYEAKKEIVFHFRGQPIDVRETRLLVVDDKVLLAAVAVRQITPASKARLRQYLRLMGLKLGIIANFHAPSLDIQSVRV